MTDRAVAGSDLFRRVEAHYREHFTREGRGEAFAEWLARLRGELAETATHGADPAFIPTEKQRRWLGQLHGRHAAPRQRAG